MTTSMKMRSGRTSRARLKHSEPSAADTVSNPCFSRAVLRTCTSVGESSTIMIKATAESSRCGLLGHVTVDGAEELVFGERFRQVLLRADEATASSIEQPILARQHDDGCVFEYFVVFDQRAGLIAVEPRHHDVDKDDVRPVIGNLRKRIEAIDGGEYFAAFLGQQ